MADGPNQRIALLSIRPRYADAILSGEKRVEFRRRGPSALTSHVIVYATAPVSKVVGWFSVDSVDLSAPEVLWHRYREVGGIEQAAFDSYYESCVTGSAIRIGRATRLESPIELDELEAGSRAPQSFRYVPKQLLAFLQGVGTGRSSAQLAALVD